MRATRLLLLLSLIAGLPPATAHADWLVTPFVGLTFSGNTTYLVEPDGLGKKLTVGGSLTRIDDGPFGFEVDFGYVSRFFERDVPRPTIDRSTLTTLTGNAILIVPRRVTRESLRPYVVGGLGLMHAGFEYVSNVFPRVDSNLLAFDAGGGAIGAITERSSLRFDLRYFKSLTEDAEAVSFEATRISFWRATVGISIRY
jgi:hypothetical protein